MANINKPAKVISMSFTGFGPCPTYLQSAVNQAINNGAILVAAAGNTAGDSMAYFPGNCAGVITVAASTRRGDLAAYTNLGSNIALAAPGGNAADPILALTANQNASVIEVTGGMGTSFSAPHVAGVLGLALSIPLLISGPQVGSIAGPYEPEEEAVCNITKACGAGILDSRRALTTRSFWNRTWDNYTWGSYIETMAVFGATSPTCAVSQYLTSSGATACSSCAAGSYYIGSGAMANLANLARSCGGGACTATQSSNYNNDAAVWGAGIAVDGDVIFRSANTGITHTLNDLNAWWKVDLGAPRSLGAAQIYNRMDSCCFNQIDGFMVWVGTNGSVWNGAGNTKCYTSPASNAPHNQGPDYTEYFACVVTARYFWVVLPGTNALHMREVEVYQQPCITAPAGNYVTPPAITAASAAVYPIMTVDNMQYYQFSTSSTISFPVATTAQVLVVGGGGSGGVRNGGGGGAGGLVYNSTYTFAANVIYTVVTGAGGLSVAPGSTANIFADGLGGSASYISALGAYVFYAAGGGNGLQVGTFTLSGGSTGGGYNTNTGSVSTANINAGVGGYMAGNVGANPTSAGANAGGGGGAGSTGFQGSGSNGGNGGAGVVINITGGSVMYAAGGGGGSNIGFTAGAGGSSGTGGAGSVGAVAAVAGLANTGSGGGGSGYSGASTASSGAGAKGVVIISWPTYAPCYPGAYLNSATQQCATCPAMSFSISTNASSCTSCPLSTYSASGATACSNNAAGTYQNLMVAPTTSAPTTTYMDSGGITRVAYSFLANGFISFTQTVTVDILVVGGGGAGGGDIGGGGGGGGVVYEKSVTLNAGTYTVDVGAGGAGSPAAATGTILDANGANNGVSGTPGYASSIKISGSVLALNSITYQANGGGGGDCYSCSSPSKNGGSGAGGACVSSAVTAGGTANQGNTFWSGTANVAGGYNGVSGTCTTLIGGGGGGASATGSSGTGGQGASVNITGSVVVYGSGGGGGTIGNSFYSGGTNAGAGNNIMTDGNGYVTKYTTQNNQNGFPNTGAGGGGGGYNYKTVPNSVAGAGGSGIVVVAVYASIPCPAGSFCINGTSTACPAGFYSVSGASACTPAPAGTYAANISSLLGGLSNALVTTDVSGYVVASFRSNGTVYLPNAISADVLLISGGGGGGGASAGGGGAGAVVFVSQYAFAAATYAVAVGAGGAPGSGWNTASAYGGTGGTSGVGTLLQATGGGGGGAGGGSPNMPYMNGQSGGCGGGGGGTMGGSAASGGAVASSVISGVSVTPSTSAWVLGFAGGAGIAASDPQYENAGGGGGAGGVGASTNSNTACSVGGAGVSGLTTYSFTTYFGTAYTSVAVSGYVAGGGAGGAWSSTSYTCSGGSGGGGNGFKGPTTGAMAAVVNTGSGGGGSQSSGGSGASGLVLMRFCAYCTCSAGSYSVSGASACTPCAPNTFSVAGASICSACPANSFSAAGSSLCAANVGYVGPTILYPFLSGLVNVGSQAAVATVVGAPAIQAAQCDSANSCRTAAYFGNPTPAGNSQTTYMTTASSYPAPMSYAYWGKMRYTPNNYGCALSMDNGASVMGWNSQDTTFVGIYANFGSAWGTPQPYFTPTPALTNNVWYHMVTTMALSGSTYTITLYLNGVQVVSATTTAGNIPGYTTFYVGTCLLGSGAGSSSGGYAGWLSDVRLYEFALTPAQVSAIYSSGNSTTPTTFFQCPGTCAVGQTLHCSAAGIAVCCGGGQFYVDGQTTATTCGTCLAGSACPNGTSTACAAGFYSAAGVTACTACAAGTTSATAATGGNVTSDVAGYYVHTFTASGSIVFTQNTVVDVLVGGAGGPGGLNVAGGGGAGAIIFYQQYVFPAGTYSVAVGGQTLVGINGGDSSIFKGSTYHFTAKGGGYGASQSGNALTAGNPGGSSGGIGDNGGNTAGMTTMTVVPPVSSNVVANIAGQGPSQYVFGNAGGGYSQTPYCGQSSVWSMCGGSGGGGAGAAGGNHISQSIYTGAGGNGIYQANGIVLATAFGQAYTNVAVSNGTYYYIGGGGGGAGTTTYGAGGLGGGGAGAGAPTSLSGNTCSGGGGNGGGAPPAAMGSNGLVMLRYQPCQACPAGSFAASMGSPTCTACPAGSYSAATGASNCSLCPSGTFSNATNATNATTCSLCSMGQYCPAASTTNVQCLAGYYCPNTTVQILCLSGQYCPAASTTNAQCLAGSYCPTTNSSIFCSNGSYCPTGSVNQTLCAAGSFCANPRSQVSCYTNTLSYPTPVAVSTGAPLAMPNNTFCSSYQAGYTAQASAVATYAAPFCNNQVGDYQWNYCYWNTGTYCSLTLVNRGGGINYANVQCAAGCIQANNCTTCGKGMYTTSPCTTMSDTICSPCATGNTTIEGWSQVCNASFCPAGSLSAQTCPAGSYCPNSTTIISCVLGQYCPAGSFNNAICRAGYYCPNTNVQIQCVSGQYCPTASTSNPQCLAGYYCPNTTVQILCLSGQYCPAASTTNAQCLAGSYCPTTNSSIFCSNGSYCPTGSVNQTLCAAGSFCANPRSQVSCYTNTLSYPTPVAVSTGAPLAMPNNTFCSSYQAGYTAQASAVATYAAPFCNNQVGDYQWNYCYWNTGTYCSLTLVNRGGGINYANVQCAAGCIQANNCTTCGTGMYTSSPCTSMSNAICSPCATGNTTIAGWSQLCSNASFCPAGSLSAQMCPLGSYCPNSTTLISCVLGQYCPTGSFYNAMCLAGYYCPNTTVQILCLSGQYCPAASTTNAQCQATYYCPNATLQILCGSGQYCPAASTTNAQCQAAYYCPNTTVQILCGSGKYCPAASTTNAQCLAGYYCPNTTIQIQAPLGFYSGTGATSTTACQPCSPYATPTLCPAGSTSDVSSCSQCNAGYYGDGRTCTLCSPNFWCFAGVNNGCPQQTNSPANSSSQNQCQCNAGFVGNGSMATTSPCAYCWAGFYCPGGNSNTSYTCPANSTSPPGSSSILQCMCRPGFFGNNGTNCTLCTPNSYCASGLLSNCSANSQSTAGSVVLSSCTCNPGFYGPAGGNCTQCPTNSYCTGGSNISGCVTNAVTAGPQTISSGLCFCDRGYSGINNSACVSCAAGTWCWTGIPNNCPSNTNSAPRSSYNTNCTCNAGYSGSGGGPVCTQCDVGYYSAQGASACVRCSAGSYCPSAGLAQPTQCAAGGYSAASFTACLVCPAGSYYNGSGVMANLARSCGGVACAATQSSLYQAGLGAYIAVDGVVSNSGISCTNSDLNAWWMVDLGAPQILGAAQVYNRMDSSQTNIDGFMVWAGSNNSVWNGAGNTNCYTSPASNAPHNQAPYYTEYFACAVTARYFWVVLPGTNYLHTREVEVYPPTCLTCPAGSFSNANATTCSLCSTGQYCPAASTTNAQCLAGYYCPNATVQIACRSGTSSPTVGATNATVCGLCPAVTYSSYGASACTPCAGDTYTAGTGSSACTSGAPTCNAGAYADPNIGTCAQCQAGTYQPTSVSYWAPYSFDGVCGNGWVYTNQMSDGQVVYTSGGMSLWWYSFVWIKGYAIGGDRGYCSGPQRGGYDSGGNGAFPYLQASNVQNCPPCSAGNFCPNTTTQTLCSVGYYCSSGSTAQTLCTTTGSYCPANSGAQTLCAAGFYCPNTTVQIPCLSGQYCPAASTTNAQCLAGYYCPNTTVQIPCSSNTFSVAGSSVCAPCLVGSSSLVGSSACVALAGYYDLGLSLMAYYTFDASNFLGDSAPSPLGILGTSTTAPTMAVGRWTGTYAANLSQGGSPRLASDYANGQWFSVPSFTLASPAFTSCFWYLPAVGASASTSTAIFGLSGTSYSSIYSIGVYYVTGNYMFAAYTGGAVNDLLSGNAYLLTIHYDNQWFHMCSVVSGARVTLYKNGVLGQTKTLSNNITAGVVRDANFIGRSINANQLMWGTIDEVRFYTSALTAAEVAAVYSYNSTMTTATMPVLCPSGMYSAANASVCTQCLAAYYCPNTTVQIACLSGQYCPAASTSNPQCQAGYYCPNTTVQILCGSGQYCPAASTANVQCLAGYYCLSTTSQLICPAGYYCATGCTSPIPCTSGKYSSVMSSACPLCPSPSTSNGAAANYTSCFCPPGSMGNVTSPTSASCISCPSGTFCPGVSCNC